MLAPPARVHDSPRRFRFLLSVAIAAAAVLLSTGIQHAQSSAAEVRALWVTRASLTSPASIASLVDSASASGFNTLLVQVRGRGDAYFANSIEPRADALTGQPADFDPLDVVLRRAHAQGLRVHAWIDVNLISSATEFASSRSHIVWRHPEWLMVPRPLAYDLAHTDVRSPEYVGKLARWTRAADDVEGLFASPILPDAATHVIRIVDDLAQRYPVDGVHLDYIRYPGPQFDYSLGALQAFRQDLDAAMTPAERRRFDPSSVAALIAATDTYPDRWAGFRRSRLNALVMRLRTVVKERRPDAIVSAAVYPDAQEASEPSVPGLVDVGRESLDRRRLPDGLHAGCPNVRHAGGLGATGRGDSPCVGRHRRLPAFRGADRGQHPHREETRGERHRAVLL